jgi:hypothetical protein
MAPMLGIDLGHIMWHMGVDDYEQSKILVNTSIFFAILVTYPYVVSL